MYYNLFLKYSYGSRIINLHKFIEFRKLRVILFEYQSYRKSGSILVEKETKIVKTKFWELDILLGQGKRSVGTIERI